MYFEMLHLRLVAVIKSRIRNGEVSERRLAHISGISQPHIHNVLKGVRVLSPRLADRILKVLGISILDLIEPSEVERLRSLKGTDMPG